jgi:hypothetical protein
MHMEIGAVVAAGRHVHQAGQDQFETLPTPGLALDDRPFRAVSRDHAQEAIRHFGLEVALRVGVQHQGGFGLGLQDQQAGRQGLASERFDLAGQLRRAGNRAGNRAGKQGDEQDTWKWAIAPCL